MFYTVLDTKQIRGGGGDKDPSSQNIAGHDPLFFTFPKEGPNNVLACVLSSITDSFCHILHIQSNSKDNCVAIQCEIYHAYS